MKILMTGGTGLIGSHFIDKYRNQHQFTVTSRSPDKAKRQLGDDVTVLRTIDEVEDIQAFDAVINLQGAGIADKRWTAHRKQQLQNSRWQVTEKLAARINAAEKPPKVWLSGSAIGVYGPRDKQPLAEDAKLGADDFAADLRCQCSRLMRTSTLDSPPEISPKQGLPSCLLCSVYFLWKQLGCMTTYVM